MEADPQFESHEKILISKTQVIFLAVVLVVAGAFFLDRRFGWFDALFGERVQIPSAAYVEAIVTASDEGVIAAERIARSDAGEKEAALPKKLEILTDEKTVFAKMTRFGPLKISRVKISEGDIVWIYRHVRSLEEVLKAPADPDLAIPLEEILKDPRERIKADFVILVNKR